MGGSMNIVDRKYKILLVDDDPAILSSVQNLFSGQNEIEIQIAKNSEEVMTAFNKAPYEFAVVLMDFNLAGMSGAELTKEIIKINPHQIVAMYSGDESQKAAIESWRSGAVDFIEKRLSPEETKRKINLSIKKYAESSEIFNSAPHSTYRETIESIGLSGGSPEMAKIAEYIKRAANTDACVLITGESGVGKEEVAKAIHRLSKRNTMPFVAENMSAITKELFESKMFGHVKGSFTGATENHQGLFKKAHCGTLFMDEIGDMPLEQQAKLLRAIQEGEFFPVGSSKTEKVNVRLIVATNKELEKEVLAKTFRQDLFYRLNIINIKVPPLRERIEDIRPLVESFRKKNKIRQIFLMEVIKKFESYSWPGNIRELYSELLRITSVFQDESRITIKHLDSKFFDVSPLTEKQKLNLTFEEFHQHSQEAEKKLILEVVRKYRSLRLAASEGLKIPYSTLQSRIKKLNLNLGGENEKIS